MFHVFAKAYPTTIPQFCAIRVWECALLRMYTVSLYMCGMSVRRVITHNANIVILHKKKWQIREAQRDMKHISVAALVTVIFTLLINANCPQKWQKTTRLSSFSVISNSLCKKVFCLNFENILTKLKKIFEPIFFFNLLKFSKNFDEVLKII